MRITKWLLLVLIVFSACHHKDKTPKPDIKFERSQWDTKESDGKNYTYRKQMIYDLLTNYKWQGMSRDSVIKMLGEPDGTEEDIFMLYHYEQKYLGSFVMSTQCLVVQLENDSTVKLARTN